MTVITSHCSCGGMSHNHDGWSEWDGPVPGSQSTINFNKFQAAAQTSLGAWVNLSVADQHGQL